MHLIPLCLFKIEKEDDRAFMSALYMEHHMLMYRIALQYVHNLTDAEDIVNSACESLLKRLPRVRSVDPKAHPAYLMVTIQNQAKLFLKKKKREHFIAERLYHEQELHDNEPDVTDEIIYRHTVLELQDLLKQLCPEDRLVLRMRCFENLSFSEIARIMNVGESTVRSRLCRARQRLHALMEEVDSDAF